MADKLDGVIMTGRMEVGVSDAAAVAAAAPEASTMASLRVVVEEWIGLCLV